MKKLFKLAFVLIIFAIFAFSNNSTITKIRTIVIEQTTKLLDKGDKFYDEKETEVIKNFNK